ncbi:MAG TPA: DUF4410 domain-containing protein [Pyrinomonadaceae bacterium]|jgi:hypothetical protein
MFRRALLLGLCAAALSLSNAFGQDAKAPAPAAPEKGKYQNAEVAPFTAQEGVQMTPEQLKGLTDAVVKELQDIKKFKQVSLEGAAPAADAAQAPTLKVSSTVTKFKAGSRAKRYMIGFGAGKSKVIAHVRFIDRETGAVLYEFDADGDVVMGLFGGNSGGAKSELAGQVAKAAKKRFF